MIQISPHMEAAYAPAYAEITQTPAMSAGESPYISRPENRQDQTDRIDESGDKPVSFEDILAGLLRKNETDGGEAYDGVHPGETTPLEAEAPLAADVLTDVLAADVLASPFDADAIAVERKIAGFELNQGRITGKAETADEPEKTEKIMVKADRSDALEAELSALDFSEEDKNILLSVELLLNRSAEQIPIGGDGEEALAGEIRLEAAFDEESADVAVIFTGQDEAAGAPPAAGVTETAEFAESLKAWRFGGGEGEAEARSGGQPEAGEFAAFDPEVVQPEAALRKNGVEEEGRSRLEEVRGRDRRRDRLSFEVRDLRSGEGLKPESLQLKASAETRVQGESGTHEITLELRLPDQSRNAPSAETVRETRAGQVFEDLLARELHRNFNNDIVRHASMALRDGGRGTIRLALKPESLGNVKIRLEMAENNITGHIVVESEEAMRAFEKEIHSLEQAFKESGFQSANLEMSLAADGRQTDQGRQPGADPFLPERMAAFRYDTALERAEMPLSDIFDVYRRHLSSVNVLA